MNSKRRTYSQKEKNIDRTSGFPLKCAFVKCSLDGELKGLKDDGTRVAVRFYRITIEEMNEFIETRGEIQLIRHRSGGFGKKRGREKFVT